MDRISKHISYTEGLHSATARKKGIKNIPDASQLKNMKEVAENVFEPLRIHLNIPIGINSFFRSEELNKVLGGASSSQHQALNGAAMDIDADKYGNTTNEYIFKYIKDNLEFDQLIAEGVEDGYIKWVHVSYNKNKNRNQVLIMYKEDGKTKYIPYTDEDYEKYIN